MSKIINLAPLVSAINPAMVQKTSSKYKNQFSCFKTRSLRFLVYKTLKIKKMLNMPKKNVMGLTPLITSSIDGFCSSDTEM
jgi:hypothetical protein